MIMTGLARLGRDAEVRFTQGNESVATLALAFNYGRKGSDGNMPSQWIDAALWGKRAESLAPHLKKGGLVSVVLSDAHIETYQSNGTDRSKLVARVLDIEFAGSKSVPASDHKSDPGAYQPAASYDDFSDDVPFMSLNPMIKAHLF